MESSTGNVQAMSGRAYVTLLSGESYLSGVIVLHRSLKAADALYPLYCLLSSTVPEDIRKTLEHEGIRCIRLESSAVDKAVNDDSEAFSHWNNTFDKLFVWGLTQFEKIVFLDSDMLIVRNIDSLFDKPPFSAVSADSSYPGNEGWAGGLNSGLMVISPDETMREELFGAIVPVVSGARARGLSVGDQDVVKYVLKDWGARPELHLDEGYNLFADHLSYYVRHLGYTFGEGDKPIYVVHFIGKNKPWMKKSPRQFLWYLRMCVSNPYYALACRKLKSYLKA